MQPHFQPAHKIFPIIDLGADCDFYLREKRDMDVEDFFRYYSDPQVHQFILCQIPQDLESARKELHYWRGIFYHNDGIYFAIAKKSDDRMIGSIGLTTFNAYQSRIEISYDLSAQYWGRGIMTRAIMAVLKYGFETLRVNRIEAFVAVDNIVSRNLLLKCGFTFEGILRQHRYHRGSYVDVCSFSILKQDFI
jgi:ribosomal-protein-alanine N-acetyltransferase